MNIQGLLGRYASLREKVQRAAPHKGAVAQLFDVLLHKLVINCDPRNYYAFRFYQDRRSWDEKGRYVGGKFTSRYWPYENNDLKYNVIYTNKYVQKMLLLGMAIPTARLISAIGESHEVRTREQFERLLDGIESGFVIKPISGARGFGFLALAREGSDFVAAGTRYSREALWKRLSPDWARGYLAEERIRNTPALASLHAESLNTYRVIVIKCRDKLSHLAACYLKVGRGGNQVDNSAAGGLVVPIDEEGKTMRAFDPRSGELVERHPDTEAILAGVRPEGREEVVDLALKVSDLFTFSSTLGCDIAYTERGPLVIEVNAWWASDYIQLALGRGLISDRLAAGLKKRNFLSRWDKSRMHPGFHKVRSK